MCTCLFISLLKPSLSDHSFCIWCIGAFPAHSPWFLIWNRIFKFSATVMIFWRKHVFCDNLVHEAKGAQYPHSFPSSSSLSLCAPSPHCWGSAVLYLVMDLCCHFKAQIFLSALEIYWFLVVLRILQRKLIQFNIFNVFVRRPFDEFEQLEIVHFITTFRSWLHHFESDIEI